MDLIKFYNDHFQAGKISTDSRKISPGDIFIALRGEKFNGNLYAAEARKAGAKIAVVEHSPDTNDPFYYQVGNTLDFLQDLANHHRRQLQIEIIGLTGSNGKTTTKELLSSVLREKYRIHATPGNLNNHIGVPLTLLSVTKDIEICIVEMGANHPGEIETLCRIAEPDSGLITNIGMAHIEGFGSFEGVRKTKAELYDFLKTNHGRIYFNASDKILKELVGTYKNCVRYNSEHELRSEILGMLPFLSMELISRDGTATPINTQLFGKFNQLNIMAAAAVSLDLGLDLHQIKKGIEDYHPENYRSQIFESGSTRMILDCYNANPTSMTAALNDFAELPVRKKIVILGSMKELGPVSAEEHQKIVRLAIKHEFDTIILIGKEFGEIHTGDILFFETTEKAKSFIRDLNTRDAGVLIKGSRSNRLEEVGRMIQESLQ